MAPKPNPNQPSASKKSKMDSPTSLEEEDQSIEVFGTVNEGYNGM
jgi:hypothetical protein